MCLCFIKTQEFHFFVISSAFGAAASFSDFTLTDSGERPHLRQLMLTHASVGSVMASLFSRLDNRPYATPQRHFFSTLVSGKEDQPLSYDPQSESESPAVSDPE
jgi:hypothetical protein